MVLDKNGYELQIGNIVFDTYCGDFGKIVAISDSGENEDVQVKYECGEIDFAFSCDLELLI